MEIDDEGLALACWFHQPLLVLDSAGCELFCPEFRSSPSSMSEHGLHENC